MVVIQKSRISDFIKEHPTAADSLNRWFSICKNCSWSNHADLKATFITADYIGADRYVFNIKGNDFRLVSMIHFNKRTIYIRFIGTHEIYNSINCLTI